MRGKIQRSTFMIDNYCSRGQSETSNFIGWFQSGDQNSYRVRNKLVWDSQRERLKHSILLSLIPSLVGRMMK